MSQGDNLIYCHHHHISSTTTYHISSATSYHIPCNHPWESIDLTSIHLIFWMQKLVNDPYCNIQCCHRPIPVKSVDLCYLKKDITTHPPFQKGP